ncbi:MAG: APC family permease [Pseudomonadales bacterium]
MTESAPTLKRALNLPMLVLYGMGTTIGAGIYALVGEIAGVAGDGAPFSFLIASIIAGFTACSFAELAGRYPRAAGAALYVQQGFGDPRLGLVVGLLVVLAGVVSSAALVNGFTGYLQEFVPVQRGLAITGIAMLLGGVAIWGIAESVTAAALITIVETGGLLLVVVVGADAFAALPERWVDFLPGSATAPWAGAFLGVSLAFYAFIGFEDMVDVAEEVKDVQRVLPLGILLTLGFTTLIYLLLMVSALLALPPQDLAQSSAPLALLYQHHTGQTPLVIGVIALFAIINGALIQIIMASRVLYGLASRGQLPGALSRVSAVTRTPVLATLIVTGLIVVLALLGRLGGLAATTSVIMLSIFTLANLALWRIKARGRAPAGVIEFPRWFPLVGALLSAGFVLRELLGAWYRL